jgi:hypothetical protein
MKRLLARGLAAIALLMVTVFSFTGCTNDGESVGWTFDWTIDVGWVGALVIVGVLAIIGLIVYFVIKKRDKK